MCFRALASFCLLFLFVSLLVLMSFRFDEVIGQMTPMEPRLGECLAGAADTLGLLLLLLL